MLSEFVDSCKSIKGKAALIYDFYKSRRLQSSLEPMWIHEAYDIVKKYLNDEIQKEEMPTLYDIIKSHSLPDGTEVSMNPNMPRSGIRIMHEGWKIGTPTWIFMGRSLPDAIKVIGSKWIAVKREVPTEYMKLFDPELPNVIWFAYHLDKMMGIKEQNCIGPSLDYDALVEEIEKQK